MYSDKNIKKIKDNLDKISSEAEEIFIRNHYEPSLKEIDDVYKIILKFLKKKKKIIYGGYAQNSLILHKNKKDGFYKDTDLADIEFYSYEPVKDLIDLTDLIHKDGYFNTIGKSGVHDGTYKIFSNFHAYCDISYMPKNIYDRCPTMVVKDLVYTHPHFMLVDAFRIYTDIIIFNWRLSKTFNRFTKLQSYYQFDENFKFEKINYESKIKDLDKIQKFIRSDIIHNNNLIVVGHYAFNYYVKKTSLNEYEIENIPFYQLISDDYENDCKKIYKKLTKKYKKITVKEYYPFFQFFDKRIEFIYEGEVILKLYGNYEKCVPYRKSDKKSTLFGTFQLVILYLLIDYNYAIINRKNKEKIIYMSMIVKLYEARNDFLNKNKLDVLDDSPFREFTLKCIGKHVDQMRNAMIKGLERIKKGKKFQFQYVSKEGSEIKIPNVVYDNQSGNEIRNKNHLTKLN